MLRGGCKLPLASHELQTLPQLPVADPENRRLQPHQVLQMQVRLLLGVPRELEEAQCGNRGLLPVQSLPQPVNSAGEWPVQLRPSEVHAQVWDLSYNSGQSYKKFAIVNYDSRVIIWAVFSQFNSRVVNYDRKLLNKIGHSSTIVIYDSIIVLTWELISLWL